MIVLVWIGLCLLAGALWTPLLPIGLVYGLIVAWANWLNR